MRKATLLLTLVLAITVIPVLSSDAIAQDQSLHPELQLNLEKMSKVMADIAKALGTGKMSPDAQKSAAYVTDQVSQILHELSRPGVVNHQSHKKKVEVMKKKWNPWGVDDEGGSKD